MSEDERDEEAAAVKEYERLRMSGMSLQEIGAGRAKLDENGELYESPTRTTTLDEKVDMTHVEKV